MKRIGHYSARIPDSTTAGLLSESTGLAARLKKNQRRDTFQRHWSQLVTVMDAGLRQFIGGYLPRHLDKDDLVQEIWLRAYQKLEKFDPQRAQFRTWLFQVAKNIVIDYLRGEKGRARTSAQRLSLFDREGEVRFEPVGPPESFSEDSLHEDLLKTLWVVWLGFNQLDEKKQRALWGHEGEKKSVTAMGVKLGLSYRTVRYHIDYGQLRIGKGFVQNLAGWWPKQLSPAQRKIVHDHYDMLIAVLAFIWPKTVEKAENPLVNRYSESF